MDTNRRMFLALACAGALLLSTGALSVAEEVAAPEVVHVTLDVQGMH